MSEKYQIDGAINKNCKHHFNNNKTTTTTTKKKRKT
jgi:hypothetical protein